jgi:predicted RNA-binding protein (virulence factor B family)
MEYQLIQTIGNCIDSVYKNQSEDGSRKTIAKLSGENMTISYITILNAARDQELHMMMQNIQKESQDMINSRLRTIKAEFKKDAGRALKAKKVSVKDNVETLTVSAFSPFRKLKYTYTVTYEIA